MKKLFILLLILIISVTCTACGGKTSTGTPQVNTPTASVTGTTYTIKSYYDSEGGYSALGLALTEENGEKVLTVNSGDTIIVDGISYSVTAETLTIPFYTQPSLDEVSDWWTEYCESRIERGEVVAVDYYI